MQRYADASLGVTSELVESAQHDEESFEVQEFLNLGPHPDTGALQVLVRWKGFDESHDSWEPAEQMHIDVPAKLQKFLRDYAAEHEIVRDFLDAHRQRTKRGKPRRKAKRVQFVSKVCVRM